MNQIYGNKLILDTIESMRQGNRLSNAILLFGERGLGKKTLAAYIASVITQAKNPYAHPDVIWVEHSGKTNGFSVADLRDLCVDAYIIPNTSENKVYILGDCDNISTAAQDTLLKIIEEPPLHTHFIFTASDKNVFLPTIISRVISLGVSECTFEECHEALKNDFKENEIKEAFDAFPGNIGLIKEYLSGGELKELVQITKDITDCITNKDEYKLLIQLNKLTNNKKDTQIVLSMLDKIVRDSIIIKLSDVKLTGCYREGASKLSDAISIKKIQRIHEILTETIKELDTNVGLSIEMSALCARIISV